MSMENENLTTSGDPLPQPIMDRDTSIEPDPDRDPAQAEWDRSLAAESGQDIDAATATGADPAEIPQDDDQIPAADMPSEGLQPESQGLDPLVSDLGEDGEGDLAPEDL
jgi:hypothetical protein